MLKSINRLKEIILNFLESMSNSFITFKIVNVQDNAQTHRDGPDQGTNVTIYIIIVKCAPWKQSPYRARNRRKQNISLRIIYILIWNSLSY